MNTDIDPLSRWLDGHATEAQTDALVRAVEEDPAALQSLVEVSLMEAGLRQHLQECEATARPLSLPPVWHWKRAGRWIAAAGSLAAAGVAAWLFLSPSGNAGAPDTALADATAGKMKVRRVPAGSGERAQIPGGSVHPGNVPPMSPLVERTYRPSEEVMAMFENQDSELGWVKHDPSRPVLEVGERRPFRLEHFEYLAGLSEDMPEGDPFRLGSPDQNEPRRVRLVDDAAAARWADPDARLGRFLRGSAVEFPAGAIARWVSAEEVSLTLSETGHAEAARVLALANQNPYPGVTITAAYYTIMDPPVAIRTDCVLSSEAMWSDAMLGVLTSHRDGDSEPHSQYNLGGPPRTIRVWPEMQSRLRLPCQGILGMGQITTRGGMQFSSEVPLSFSLWRVGGNFLLRGVVGVPLGFRNEPLAGISEIEFELTLVDGEYAFIHLDDAPAVPSGFGKHFVVIGLRANSSAPTPPAAKSEAIPLPGHFRSPAPARELSNEEMIERFLSRHRDTSLLRDRPMEATIRCKAGVVICQVHGTGDGVEIRLPQGPILAFSTATRKWVRKDEADREIQGSSLIPGTDLACEDLVPATWPWLHWTKRTLRGEDSVKTRDCFVLDLTAPDAAARFGTVRVWVDKDKGQSPGLQPSLGMMRQYGFDWNGKRIREVDVKTGMKVGEAVLLKEMTFYAYEPGTKKTVSETTVTWKEMPATGADSGE